MTTDLPFDLEYRPTRFADVLGNAGIVKLLKLRSVKRDLASRSMMFGGPKGSGKTSLARIVARSIVCDALDDGEPCNSCPGCQSVRDESADSVDEFDAATQGTVERMRSIVEDLEYGTVSGKPRVVVLDEAHRLSKASQDALLKAMEARQLVVILCTTEPHAIKTAIRSRVDEYPVSYPPPQELVARLGKVCNDHKIPCGEDLLTALSLIVELNGNCPRTSLTDLQSAAKLGGVTVDNVRQITRFGSLEGVVRALSVLPTDPRAAVAEFDALFDQEGAVWVRDQVVAAISSAMRTSFGARATFPVPSGFWESRGRAWLDIAHALSVIDRPNQADIEAVLYMNVVPASGGGDIIAHPVPPVAPPAPPPVAPPIAAPVVSPAPVPTPSPPDAPTAEQSIRAPQAASAPPPKPESKAAEKAPPKEAPKAKIRETLANPSIPRKLEIDGVIFTSDEELTSMDKKILHGPTPEDSTSVSDVRVEYDPESVPMTQKEFSSGFLERIRS